MRAASTSWPPGQSEMAERIRAFDWTASPVGPLDTWPAALKSAVALVLDSGFAAALVWGPELVTIYNDHFRPILGDKPEALGRSFAEVWHEAWADIGPLVDQAFAGQATFIEDYPLVVDRSGAPEQAYFTFAYSPVRAADGSVVGMIDTVIETTADVQARAQVRASEARYRALSTASADVIYRMGPDWTEMRRLDGRGFIADTAHPSASWLEAYIDPADQPAVTAEIGEALRAKRPFDLEHRVRRVDGTLGWTHSRAVPLLDDRGELVEWIGAASDITERKRAEHRQAFLLELSDALRPLEDPITIQEVASRLLGDHLGADRVMYGEADGDETFVIHRAYRRAEDMPSPVGRHRFDDYGAYVATEFRAGRTLVVADVVLNPEHTQHDLDQYAEVGIRAYAAVPLVKGGRIAAHLAVNQATPRVWTKAELALMQETAGRTWAAVEQARAEAELRESEERFRTLFEAMDEGFCIIEKIDTAPGAPSDFRYLVANPAFERHAHIGNVVGKTMRELVPGADFPIIDIYDHVALTGEPLRFETYVPEVNIWIDAFAVRIGLPTEGGVAVLFRDVSERMRAQEALHQSEDRLRLIIETATDYAIFTTDTEKRIDSWPAGAEAVLGWTADEVMGQPFDMTFTPEDRAGGVPEQEYAEARDTGSASDVRWHLHKDGRRVFIAGMTLGLRDQGGAFQGLLKIGQDVTERRQQEHAQQETDERVRQELETRVATATIELRTLSRRLLTVQEEERRHLARELHDEIGQVLTGLAFQLGAGSGLDSKRLAEARRIVGALTEQVRQLSMDLRPATLDTHGLLPALLGYIDRYRAQTGIRVELRHQGLDRRFPPEVEIVAYRVVQEALTNVARHAAASSAVVQLLGDGALIVAIRDGGSGFDLEAATGASGLGGMRERVELVGGMLTIDSAPDRGTLVTAELPLAHDDRGGQA